MAPLRAESGAAFLVLHPVAKAPYGKAPIVMRNDAGQSASSRAIASYRRSGR